MNNDIFLNKNTFILKKVTNANCEDNLKKITIYHTSPPVVRDPDYPYERVSLSVYTLCLG